MNKLPVEIVTQILFHLDFEDQLSAVHVCELWRTLLLQPQFQATRYEPLIGAQEHEDSLKNKDGHQHESPPYVKVTGGTHRFFETDRYFHVTCQDRGTRIWEIAYGDYDAYPSDAESDNDSTSEAEAQKDVSDKKCPIFITESHFLDADPFLCPSMSAEAMDAWLDYFTIAVGFRQDGFTRYIDISWVLEDIGDLVRIKASVRAVVERLVLSVGGHAWDYFDNDDNFTIFFGQGCGSIDAEYD